MLALDYATQLQEMKAIAGPPAYALGSVHAITREGTLVIASASGSQLASYAWGATNVIFVVGAQKLWKGTSTTSLCQLGRIAVSLSVSLNVNGVGGRGGVGARRAVGADHVGRFQFDEGRRHELHRVAHEVKIPQAQRVEQARCLASNSPRRGRCDSRGVLPVCLSPLTLTVATPITGPPWWPEKRFVRALAARTCPDRRGPVRSTLLGAAQGSAATICRYSSSVKARRVSVLTLPAEPMASAVFAAAASSGASLMVTMS
jgi:hypothetical protein